MPNRVSSSTHPSSLLSSHIAPQNNMRRALESSSALSSKMGLFVGGGCLLLVVYPWLYSGRKSFRMGEMSGCSCARNVIAHMMYMAAAERTRVERQTLSNQSVYDFSSSLDMYAGAGACSASLLPHLITGQARLMRVRGSTYVWFSPFGARNHAAAQKMAVTTRPMKGAQLCLLAACCSRVLGGARTRLPLCRCCMCESGKRRLEVVLRRCGDAVACWELECDDACRGRAGALGALVWMGDS